MTRASIATTALAAIAQEPWRNGGGVTRTLAEGDGWRASLAEIGRDGPYSRFSGMTRLSLIVAGAGVRLHAGAGTAAGAARPGESAATHRLLPGHPVQYDGDTAWQAELIDGPAQALNLIARAGAYRLHAVTLDAAHGVPIATHAGLVVLSGAQPCELWDLDGGARWRLAPLTVLRMPRLAHSIRLCGAPAPAAGSAPASGTVAPLRLADRHWPLAAIAEPVMPARAANPRTAPG